MFANVSLCENVIRRYPQLPTHIKEALAAIEPSRDGELLYHPCRAVLKGGRDLEAVYIVPAEPYLEAWGVIPEDDKAKRSIRIEDVDHVEESLSRLPAPFANQLYESGESGMGYTIFTVVFKDGERQACISGNTVDFVSYPPGKSPIDVVAVIPHEGRRDGSSISGPDYHWCLYSEKA